MLLSNYFLTIVHSATLLQIMLANFSVVNLTILYTKHNLHGTILNSFPYRVANLYVNKREEAVV